jgi:hypothetical protein
MRAVMRPCVHRVRPGLGPGPRGYCAVLGTRPCTGLLCCAGNQALPLGPSVPAHYSESTHALLKVARQGHLEGLAAPADKVSATGAESTPVDVVVGARLDATARRVHTAWCCGRAGPPPSALLEAAGDRVTII